MKKDGTLDSTDRKILSVLQREGRISNVDLADRVALSPTPCLERVRRLEREGFITGYVALADPTRLNLNTQAFIQVSLNNTSTESLRDFAARIRVMPEVESLSLIHI